MSGHEATHGITISLSSVVGYLRRLRRSRRYRRDDKEDARREDNGRLSRSRESEEPVLEPQEMPEQSSGAGGVGGGGGRSTGDGTSSSRDGWPTAMKLFAARYFRFLCSTGVILGTISFILSIIAIATEPWIEAEEIYNETEVENRTLIGNVTWTERMSSGIWTICFEKFRMGVKTRRRTLLAHTRHGWFLPLECIGSTDANKTRV